MNKINMENQHTLEYEIEMATLNLKGRRYREAVEKFSDLTRMTNNAGAWSGLALAKLGLITEDVTVIEVFHCFTNALHKAEKKEEVKALSIEAAKEAIKELYEVYVKAVLISRKAEKDAFKQKLNSFAGAFLTIDGHRSKNSTSSIIGAGLTALSYNDYLNAKNTAEELSGAADRIKGLISEIVEQTYAFNSDNDTEKEAFKVFVNAANQRAVELTMTEDEKKSSELKKVEEERMKQKYLSQEDASEILNDENHIYHLYIREARSLYKEEKFLEAFQKISFAHQICPNEKETSLLRQKYGDALKEKHSGQLKKDIKVLVLIMVVLFGISLLDYNDIGEVASGFFYMSLFGAAIIVYRKINRDKKLKMPTMKE